MKILILGASGLLGSSLTPYLESSGHSVFSFSRQHGYPCRTESEICEAFSQILAENTPDCVINLVAGTNVDDCEKDPSLAEMLNFFIPKALGSLCTGGPHLIHISTDQVYGGVGPHHEANTFPLNVYARTKLAGELPVVDCGGCVLRTNFFGKSRSPKRSSFSDWLFSAGQKAKSIDVFEDVYFSPLRMDTLCSAICRAMELRLAGLFNVGAINGTSKAEFARLLYRRLGLNLKLLQSTLVANVSLPAQRPNDMRMASSRFSACTGFVLPTIEHEIAKEADQSYGSQFLLRE